MTHRALVIGAGPAGLSAALAAADGGMRVLVIDEQSQPGGQILRRRADGSEPANHSLRRGAALLRRAAAHPHIEWLLDTTAWGVFAESATNPAVGISGRGVGRLISGRAVIIATGAYDLPAPFPGWTLPGVITAGGAQAALKGQDFIPPGRLVLTGAHPLLVIVADQLHSAGADIAEIHIARDPVSLAEALRGMPAIAGNGAALRELVLALVRLARAGIPLHFGSAVTRAEGEERVELVHIQGPQGLRMLECDGLILGYGFASSSELARQVGCDVKWRPDAGGWVVAHDECMRTNRPFIYVAGEPTGVGGAPLAAAEGALAGAAVAFDVTRHGVDRSSALRRTQRRVRRARRFARHVQRTFPPPEELLASLVTDETVVCRCEVVTANHVRTLLADNSHLETVNSVKLACRAGMGPCQGRFCERSLARLVASSRDLMPNQVGRFTARVPVKPLSLRTLAQLDLDLLGASPSQNSRSDGKLHDGTPPRGASNQG